MSGSEVNNHTTIDAFSTFSLCFELGLYMHFILLKYSYGTREDESENRKTDVLPYRKKNIIKTSKNS